MTGHLVGTSVLALQELLPAAAAAPTVVRLGAHCVVALREVDLIVEGPVVGDP